MIVPLHTHSEHSALDGWSKITEIADRCEEIGSPCCSLTDHGVVSGHLELDKVLRPRGIKPIFGCELYHGVKTEFKGQERDAAHLIAYAQTDQGLRNLWALTDAASKNVRYVGRVTWEMLEKFNEGLIVTGACMLGLVAQGVMNGDLDPLNRYLNIFGDRFLLELHTYPDEIHQALNEEYVSLSQERGIALVPATDAHYARKDQYKFFDAYLARSTGDTLYTKPEDRTMWHPPGMYIQDADEVRESLDYLDRDVVDEAIQNSLDLGESIDASLPEIRNHLPTFIPRDCTFTKDILGYVPEDGAEMMCGLLDKGLTKRYGENPDPKIIERAEAELEVILEYGLEDYLLQTWEFCEFARREGVAKGPGRGSAAGSLAVYALEITDVDPMHYDLLFERFYNAGREDDFPDIDTDFTEAGRKKIRGFAMERWGSSRVKRIGNTIRIKPKGALEKTKNLCQITDEEYKALHEIVQDVPDLEILDTDAIGWSPEADPGKKIYVTETVGDRIDEWFNKLPDYRQEPVRRWLEIAEAVCSRIAGRGVHASGFVVADEDLEDALPGRWAGGEVKDIVTQFPMKDVAKLQYPKQDWLVVNAVGALEDWTKKQAEKGNHIDWSGKEIKDNNVEMWALLHRGFARGIFQIEQGHPKQLCEEFEPTSVEDLAIISALIRPGPSKYAQSFLKRRKGEEKVEFAHPILEDILSETEGFFLYQEQIMRYFVKLGYTLNEADAVRSILGKKKPVLMKAAYEGTGEWEGRSYPEMAAKFMDKKTADAIWGEIEDFAKYSFNKAHAVSYGVLGWRCEFAKDTDPLEFILSCVSNHPGNGGAYINEARKMGYEVLPPDIYKSDTYTSVKDDKIVFGLGNIKGIKTSAAYLIELRERYDISTPEKLYEAIEEEDTIWKAQSKEAKKLGKKPKGKSPKQKLRADQITKLTDAGAFDNYGGRDVSIQEKRRLEAEYLDGVIITDDTHEVFQNYTDEISECDDWEEFVNSNGEVDSVQLPAIIRHVKPTVTKKDKKPMGIITLGYEGHSVNVAVFSHKWKRYKFMMKENTAGVFTIAKNDRGLHFEEAIKL